MIYKKDEINFLSVSDFYSKTEEIKAAKTTALSYRIKELIENTSDEQEKTKLSWEMEAFHYTLTRGIAKGHMEYTLPDGVTRKQYPDPKDLTEEALQYLYDRSVETSNNSLKLRYQQILISSENRKYISLCTTSLIDANFKEIETWINGAEDKGRSHEIRTLVKSAFILAKKAKYRLNEVATICYDLIHSDVLFPVGGKYRLLELVVEYRKAYTKEQLENCYAVALQLSKQSPYKDDCFAMEGLVDVAKRLASILQVPSKEWLEWLGALYVAEMQKRTDDKTRMVPMHWCEKAIEQYQSAGNTEKVKWLHQQYAELRKDFKLDSIQVDFDKEALMGYYNFLGEKAKQLITKNEPDAILNYMSDGQDIFPDITWIKEFANKRNESFLDTIAISKADTNKNFSKRVVTVEDHEWHHIFESYGHYIEFSVYPFIRRLFFYGFLRRKVCYDTIMRFFQQHTWIGCTLVSKDSGGEKVNYNWLSLIGPALHNFHQNFEALLLEERNRINVVLSTDSLVLKFEGLFRDFARVVGAATTVYTKGNMREMYMEELLDLEEMKQHFNENDMLLFRYLFLSKNGLNLRNNVAHGFLNYNQYRIEYMLLIIMALLRLGKYTVDTRKQTY